MCEGRFRSSRAWKICISIAALGGLLQPAISHAGLPLPNVRCGQQVQGRFTQADQVQEHRIDAEPGQTLDIQVAPVGEYLKVWTIVVEPSGATIADSKYQKKVQLTTGQLSAKGIYLIKIYNTSLGPEIEERDWGFGRGRHETLTGDYVLSITCVNSDGTWVVQGAKNEDPSAPPGTGGQANPAAAPTKPPGKYGKEIQEIQATIGGVATTIQAFRELWGAFRPRRQAPGGEPAPVYESPQDMVPRGQHPVYAKPVEAPAAPPQRVADVSRMLPSGGRGCQDNYEESGGSTSGKSFRSHVDATGTTLERAFLAVGRAIGLEGFLGVTTNKDLGLISAYLEDSGRKSTLSAVLSESGPDIVRVEIAFRPARETEASSAEVRERLCRLLAAVNP